MARTTQKNKQGKNSSRKKILTVIISILVLIVGNFGGGKLLNLTGESSTTIVEFLVEKVETYLEENIDGQEPAKETQGDTDNQEPAKETQGDTDNQEPAKEVQGNTDNQEPAKEVQGNADKKSTKSGNGKYDESDLVVYFYDVGQADSILLLTDDRALLVDCGEKWAAELDTELDDNINLTYELKRLGVGTTYKHFEVVGTHFHDDHVGSLYKIAQVFEIDNLYVNSFDIKKINPENTNGYYEQLVKVVDERNIHITTPTTLTVEEVLAKVDEYNSQLEDGEEKLVYNPNDYIRVGDYIEFGDAKITMLAPNSAKYSDANDYSIVLMVEFEDVKLMLTGDAGKKSEEEILKYAEANGIDLNCDILKVAHHGSRTASTEEFIAAVDPEYAVIMVGAKTTYDLPDEEPIERLEKQGATIYQTVNEGDIKLTIDDGEYDFELSFTHHKKEDKK